MLCQIYGIAEGQDKYQWGGHPARLGIVTGKMPVPQPDAHSIKMPVPSRCPFHSQMPVPQNY
ncbi:hypothetical protein [Moorena sp. SIO3B2]|uniref:hypothetical protein n=1 Tax=Moorena sp. SIO3B2 TaxID=2607827 RepID=UPI0013CB0B7E|nr:hypothetical protein [Moorena sp. SIO3B2]NEP36545.1 hypothetical protein [Moorena sp. SIO3B2]